MSFMSLEIEIDENNLGVQRASKHDWYFRKCSIVILRGIEYRHRS